MKHSDIRQAVIDALENSGTCEGAVFFDGRPAVLERAISPPSRFT
jgi:hypothetical protein